MKYMNSYLIVIILQRMLRQAFADVMVKFPPPDFTMVSFKFVNNQDS